MTRGRYCGQSYRRCYYEVLKKIKFIEPKRQREPKDKIDECIAINQEACLFCAESLLVQNHKDSVKAHCHMTGKYRGALHNEFKLKLKLNAKTVPMPVVFHNLKGYDSHILMQVMVRVQGEMKCIPTNTEKYISFSQVYQQGEFPAKQSGFFGQR